MLSRQNVSDVMKLFGPNGLAATPILRPHLGMHHNGLLRKDEWIELDRVVLETAKTELNGVQDLISLGLVKRLGGLGSKVSAYERIGDMTAATVSMSVDVAGEKDRVEYTQVNVPIPVIFKDFAFDLRDLQSARQSGDPLETDNIAAATRVVTEGMETMLFSGSAVQLGGYIIYGYTNHPNRVQSTAAALGGGDWGTAGNAHKTIQGALTSLRALGFRGPFMVYVASTQYGQTLSYFDTANPQSEKAAILQNMPEVRDIKPSFELTDGQLVVVQMTSNVVDLAVGFSLAPISWVEMGGMITEYRVMTALAPPRQGRWKLTLWRGSHHWRITRGDIVPDTKYTYRVRSGRRWGPYHEYGPGMTVKLTEDEASGFLDTLELVKDGKAVAPPPDEAGHLATLTAAQLKELPEYAELENPKPQKKADILQAILEARGLLPEDEGE